MQSFWSALKADVPNFFPFYEFSLSPFWSFTPLLRTTFLPFLSLALLSLSRYLLQTSPSLPSEMMDGIRRRSENSFFLLVRTFRIPVPFQLFFFFSIRFNPHFFFFPGQRITCSGHAKRPRSDSSSCGSRGSPFNFSSLLVHSVSCSFCFFLKLFLQSASEYACNSLRRACISILDRRPLIDLFRVYDSPLWDRLCLLMA